MQDCSVGLPLRLRVGFGRRFIREDGSVPVEEQRDVKTSPVRRIVRVFGVLAALIDPVGANTVRQRARPINQEENRFGQGPVQSSSYIVLTG